MSYANKRIGRYLIASIGLAVGCFLSSCQESGPGNSAVNTDITQFSQEVKSIYNGVFQGYITNVTDTSNCPWKDKTFVLTLDLDDEARQCNGAEDEPDATCDNAAQGEFNIRGQLTITDGPMINLEGYVSVKNLENYYTFMPHLYPENDTSGSYSIGNIVVYPQIIIPAKRSEQLEGLVADVPTTDSKTTQDCEFVIDERESSVP